MGIPCPDVSCLLKRGGSIHHFIFRNLYTLCIMLDAIIRFSIRNKAVIGFMTLGLVAWGLYSATQLPIDAVPDITDNQVQVITVAPSQSAQDIERLVTFPVEQTMTTIPGIQEIRSFSRFGLSVVTLVFQEQVDVYWARQQVDERLGDVKTKIPAGIGIPELAPMTTGLGEIYQYVLHPLPGYEARFDPMELRTLQDWIVRRQLLGVEGVADVSSFGGYLKQYEIALDPARLRSMDVSLGEVFTALERNNQNTGGSYIDKRPYAWFIRSEGLVEGLEDIANVPVRAHPDGIPVLIRDIGTVGYGHAQRYGAMTRNDEGEVVGGVVMMLKGANSSEVIANVKERIGQISKTLPAGVMIEPYLDRTKLVNKAISTVSRNLVEGALIVVLVLVLLLGNLRGGLIVASVIPLSMLFAVAMMNLFGVSGNLMSLGAIDFGLIVDGAVIIVEATLHHLATMGSGQRLSQAEMDREVLNSASSIRNSAAFGELIILIVYLPILTLVGIEGKMFKPMAQTVSFAILGAFLLSITYVPMASSVFLAKGRSTRRTVSDQLMAFFQRLYHPTIRLSLRYRWGVVAGSLLLLGMGFGMFSRLGAEFIPTLEEGDFAVETRVLTGSSMEETIAASQRAAKVLIEHFPEVKEVIGKVGSSEIPTDPMPMENSDLIVVLTDKADWKSAGSREELAEKMADVLQEHVPGVTFGFQQPIQMRFNELMSGARQDVVIKIYGENLDSLALLAEQVGALAAEVEGAKDLYIEQVGGLSQIVVDYDRIQLARFGLDIAAANRALSMAFAGQVAGFVYEGERRFDLVVRLKEADRQTLEDVRNLPVETPNGQQIPLKVVADVSQQASPNQIQRDDAKRRIMVGFNVRGRDVETVVEALRSKVEEEIDFPDGYYPRYGGMFENLVQARARLLVAVPVALLLIFLLLYLTFHSLRQSLLIFTAIPFSAIGGVLALWMRGMPFSISAGVGFIALFGVAVLNGIVLIAEFNRLRQGGMDDLHGIILQGTANRLRPVIMTAAVASLGFLPMAISGSEGAEVQRPLATVVIGGLVTATLLTLVVLPCLYMLFSRRAGKKVATALGGSVLFMALLLLPKPGSSQGVRLEDAVSLAIQHHAQIQLADMEVHYRELLTKTSGTLPKLGVNLTLGQYNSSVQHDNNLTLSQTLPFPTVFPHRKQLAEAEVEESVRIRTVLQNEVAWQVREHWVRLQHLYATRRLLIQQDSLYAAIEAAATLRFATGESNLLEKATAATARSEMRNKLHQTSTDIQIWLGRLQFLIQMDPLPAFTDTFFQPLPLPDSNLPQAHPTQALLAQRAAVSMATFKLDRSELLPEVTLGYFNQTLIGYQTIQGTEVYIGPEKRFQGFSLGVGVPLWLGPELSRLKAGKVMAQHATLATKLFEQRNAAELEQAFQAHEQLGSSLAWHEDTGLPNAQLLLRQSTLAFQGGEIDALTHLYTVQRAMTLQEDYLRILLSYNQNILLIQHLLGQSISTNPQ